MRLLLSTILAVSFLHTSAAVKFPPEKILLVSLNEEGIVSVGGDTVSSDNLARYIQERLFKSYMGTGQMHSRIQFTKENNSVKDEVVQIVLKEILEGQRRALRQLCLQKYESLFENIDAKKQDKLKKQFPVLFQTDYQ